VIPAFCALIAVAARPGEIPTLASQGKAAVVLHGKTGHKASRYQSGGSILMLFG